MALGKLLAVGAMDQRHMCEFRHIPSHRFIDRDLAKGIAQVIVTADHMRDAHIVIVHRDGEHVGRRSVGTHKDEIVDFPGLYRYSSLHRVIKHALAVIRCLSAGW